MNGARYSLLALVIFTFSPYIGFISGVRVEHLFIYGLLTLVFLAVGHLKIFLVNKILAFVCMLFCIIICVVLNVSVMRYSPNLSGLLAALENFAQPVALVILSTYFLRKSSYQERANLLEQIMFLTMLLLICNTIFAICALFVDTWEVAKYFVTSNFGVEAMDTVWGRSRSMGRLLGIFNQPLESGVAYSIGLFFWVHLRNSVRMISHRKLKLILFVAIIFGGSISISKVFLFGGLPMAFALFLMTVKTPFRISSSGILGIVLFIGGFIMLFSSLTDKWSGLNYFLRFFDFEVVSKIGFFTLITAGRFGAGTSMNSHPLQLFNQTWEEAPFFGLGAPCDGPLDNAYAAYFYYGGGVSLVMYTGILLSFLYISIIAYVRMRRLGALLFIFFVFIVGAGMGAPVLTMNRVCVILWVFWSIASSLVFRKPELWDECHD
jgi:hypothetical protein